MPIAFVAYSQILYGSSIIVCTLRILCIAYHNDVSYVYCVSCVYMYCLLYRIACILGERLLWCACMLNVSSGKCYYSVHHAGLNCMCRLLYYTPCAFNVSEQTSRQKHDYE